MGDGEIDMIETENLMYLMSEDEYLFDDMNTEPPLHMAPERIKVKTFKTSLLLNGMFKAGFVHQRTFKRLIEYNGEMYNVPQYTMHFGQIGGVVCEPTILHEMIHVFIFNFREYCENAREKEEELIEQIQKENNLSDAYLDIALQICDCGPGHDRLFYYKSLQLDVIKEYPLGTVFGYGMNEYIQHCHSVAVIAG